MASSAKTRVLHLYRLTASGAHLTFMIAIDAFPQDPGSYLLSLYCKAGNVERRIGHPVPLKLAFDPRNIDFDVCLTPKDGFPRDSLFGLRVWLRRPAHQSSRIAIFRHRIFTDEHFWISKEPDFHLKWDGSVLATPTHIEQRVHVHSAVIHGVPIAFIAKLTESVGLHEYLISLEYDIGGVTRTLCRDIDARITCYLGELSFIIYSIPVKNTSTGSTHRLFFWLRTRGVCQRLWKTDTFHVTGLTRPNDFRNEDTILAMPDIRNPIQVELVQEDEPSSGMAAEVQTPVNLRSNNPFAPLSRAGSFAISALSPNTLAPPHDKEKRDMFSHEHEQEIQTSSQADRNPTPPLVPTRLTMHLTASDVMVPEADDDPVPSYQASSSNRLYRSSLWAHSHTVFPDVEDVTRARSRSPKPQESKAGTGV